MNEYLNKKKKEWIADRSHLLQEEELEQILSMRVRCEKVAIKDIKLRTFIAEGNSRNDLAAHVYDITYGSVVPFEDNLVVIDDSIVRGTTLRQSIIGILDRLNPKKIVVVSSSPQVRYPDYYGIDMSRMSEFIAFKAAVALLVDKGMESVLLDAYKKAKRQQVRCDRKLREGDLCVFHRRGNFGQDGGTAYPRRNTCEGGDCLPDTRRVTCRLS